MPAPNALLGPQENALAYAMLYRERTATVDFVVAADGDRLHQISKLTAGDLGRLASSFSVEPKDRLAYARESLFAINRDARLSPPERRSRIGRYLDAYSDLTLRLDHMAFPLTPSGTVRSGVPDYIPDGFVDMGRERTLNVLNRDREQIVVDKREILTKYRPLLLEIFQTDYSRMTLEQKKTHMAMKIGARIWTNMTDEQKLAQAGGSSPDIDLGGGTVRLSRLSEGVCRHQSLVFQVLAQAVGIKSILVKGKLNGEHHAANMIRIEDKWYICDVANPTYTHVRPDGTKNIRPFIHPVDGPPPPHGEKRYVVSRLAPNDMQYSILSEMYWRSSRVRR